MDTPSTRCTKNLPAKCDCINICGDDPWIATGKAAPCEALVIRTQKAAELKELRLHGDLVKALKSITHDYQNPDIKAVIHRAIAAIKAP